MRTTTAGSEPMQNVPVTMDTKGRVRTSKEQRCDILAVFEHSGVSAAEFAKQKGIKYSTFEGWLQRHRRAKPKGQPPIMRLLEAVVEQTQGGAASCIGAAMLSFSGSLKVFVAVEPCDMHKGFKHHTTGLITLSVSRFGIISVLLGRDKMSFSPVGSRATKFAVSLFFFRCLLGSPMCQDDAFPLSNQAFNALKQIT